MDFHFIFESIDDILIYVQYSIIFAQSLISSSNRKYERIIQPDSVQTMRRFDVLRINYSGLVCVRQRGLDPKSSP